MTDDKDEAARDASAPEPAAEEQGEQPSASQMIGAALGGAARRAGMDPSQAKSTGHVVWHAMGGWRGIVETTVPSLAFLVTYTLTTDPTTRQGDLLLSLAISVGLAVVFTLIRIVMRQPVGAALGGLIAVAAAAALSLWTGRAQDNFVWGFITNAIYGSAFLVSAVIGWSLIGLAVGFLMNEGTAWRGDARKRRAFFWLAIAWAGLFAARLVVQLPLYFAGNVTALATLKLLMGLPLFAPLVAVTWLAVRALYPSRAK